MNHKVVTKNNKSYIKFNEDESKISSEQDVLDVISVSFETGINSLIIDGKVLTEEFYDLKTKLLGMALQKFINYNIKVAFIIESTKETSDRFKELVLEINKGANFRVFNNVEDSESWLLNL